MRLGRKGLPALLALVGTALVGSGLAMTAASPRAASSDIGTVPPPAASSVTGTNVPPPVAQQTVAAPVAMSLPHVPEVPIVPVGVLASGALQLPEKPTVLGWYAAGAAPGEAAGTAVMAGHLDSASLGPGPLMRLFDLDLGDPIRVADATGGIHRYSVVSRTSYPKPALPQEIFRRDGPPRLTIVTCGGAFDASRGQYADNIIVAAVPT